MRTIPQVSNETLKIETYLSQANNGQEITYEEIQLATGVKMDNRGKKCIRTAMKRLKREYETAPGVGIKIASEVTVSRILTTKIVRIDNAVKRGEKAYKNLNNEFYAKLTNEEKKQINFIGAAFGAIRLASQSGRKMIREKKLGNIPMLPESK